MRYILLLLIVPACLGFDFDCLKGPDFWCANIANAQKCNKVTECFLENKNQNKKVQVSESGYLCDICEEVVKYIDDRFNGFTQQQFDSALDSVVCDQLPGDTQGLCKVFVASYGPVIYNEIKNITAPGVVCGFIKACKNNGIKYTPRIFADLKLKNNDTCAKCKEVFSFVDNMFSKITPDEFKFLLETVVCGEVPSELKSTCKMLVDGYATQLYQLIKSLLDGDRMCTLLHLCSAQNAFDISTWNCQTCVDIIPVLKKDLINVSESDLANFVSSMACSKLSILIRGICNNYVDELVPVFYADIHSSLTPQQICSKNHLCSIPIQPVKALMGTSIKCSACELIVDELKNILFSTNNLIRAKLFVKTKICSHLKLKFLSTKCYDLVDNYGHKIMNLVMDHIHSDKICQMIGACNLNGAFEISSLKKMSGVECDGCKLVVGKFKAFISDPNKQAQIKNFIKYKICPVFQSETSQCQQSVDEFFSIVLNVIISELDVDKICKISGFCSSTMKLGDECSICELVADEAVSVLTSNHTQQIVTNFVISDVCPRLGSLANECVTITNTYLPFAFAIARSTLNGKLLCTELHLCTSISKVKMQLIRSRLSSNTTCDICKFVVNELHDILTNVNYQTDIENFIKKIVCSHFGINQQKCINDINQYYSLVVNVIVDVLTPSLCSEIRLCNSTNVSNFKQQPLMNLIMPNLIHDCKMCRKYYDCLKKIQNHEIKANETTLYLVAVCDQVGLRQKPQCLKILQNFDHVLTAFNKSKTRHEFCQTSKVCVKQPNPNLGKKSCSWGPGFWCISRQHAISCGPGAVKHCEMSVWSKIPIL